jgi:hypothetical protein
MIKMIKKLFTVRNCKKDGCGNQRINLWDANCSVCHLPIR